MRGRQFCAVAVLAATLMGGCGEPDDEILVTGFVCIDDGGTSPHADFEVFHQGSRLSDASVTVNGTPLALLLSGHYAAYDLPVSAGDDIMLRVAWRDADVIATVSMPEKPVITGPNLAGSPYDSLANITVAWNAFAPSPDEVQLAVPSAFTMSGGYWRAALDGTATSEVIPAGTLKPGSTEIPLLVSTANRTTSLGPDAEPGSRMSAVALSTEEFSTEPLKSDLRGSICAGPHTASAGSVVQVSNGVANEGGPTAGAFKLGLYLSGDEDITATDVFLGDRTIDALESNEESVAVAALTIPAPTGAGAYYLGVIADYELAETESDETNNALAAVSAITVTAANDVNLVVSDVSGPASAIPGNDITVNTTITNQGTTAAGAFIVQLYLSPDAQVTIDDRLLGSRQVASLAGSGSDTAGTMVTIPASMADGYYYLGAIADATGAVVESDETDNTGVSATQIVIGFPPPPDAYEPDDVAGDAKEITVDGGTQDRSFHTTTDEDWAWFLLSGGGGGVIVTADGSVDCQLYDSDGETLLVSGAGIISYVFGGPGTYYVRLLTYSSSFSYTVSVTSFTPGGNADLTAQGGVVAHKSGAAWFVDQWAFTGEPVLVIGTVENIGTDGAAAFTVDLYLSTDQTIDSSDICLGRALFTGLAAGDQQDVQVETVIPSTTAPGAYYVGAIADADAWLEADGTNNAGASLAAVVWLGIDLAANAVSAPATVGPGDTPPFDYDISLVPDGLPNPTGYARFYLSTDTTLDPSDREITSKWLPTIAPGTSNTLGLGLGYPPAGTYYVILSVELMGMWEETDYGNNTVCSSDPMVMTGGPGADLAVSSLSAAPLVLNPGEMLTVNDTVANSGDLNAAAFSVAYELTLVGHWTDIGIGSRSVAPLDFGSSDSASTPFSIPVDADGGYYELAAFADSNWEVGEQSEWNNITIASDFVAVRGPDRWEPDNDEPRGAGGFYPEVSPEGPGMTIHEAGDIDWLWLYVETPGVTLKLETVQLLEGMDTVVELWRAYDLWSLVMIAVDDDSGGEAGASAITYTFPEARSYALRVYHKDPAGTGLYMMKSTVEP